MIIFKKTTSINEDFIFLVKQLDLQLAEKNGEDQDFYGQFNKLDTIKHVIVAYKDDVAVGCGAVKQFDADSMEVKRMYTSEDYRGQGIALFILEELEKWVVELGFSKCILETYNGNMPAIHVYKKNGYKQIPNYGQYEGVEMSICFEKEL